MFQNNWLVPVLHNGPAIESLVDPILKIEVLLEAPRQEFDEVLRDLTIYYDPQFSSENLARPWTEPTALNPSLSYPATSLLVVARSQQHRRIGSLGFDARFYPERGDNPDELLVRLNAASLGAKSKLLAREAIPKVSDHPLQFFLHCLQFGSEMAAWDALAIYRSMETLRNATISRIVFVVESGVADELAPFADVNFEDVGNGFRLFAAREVRR